MQADSDIAQQTALRVHEGLVFFSAFLIKFFCNIYRIDSLHQLFYPFSDKRLMEVNFAGMFIGESEELVKRILLKVHGMLLPVFFLFPDIIAAQRHLKMHSFHPPGNGNPRRLMGVQHSVHIGHRVLRDLQALLLDLDAAGFENTVAVGQLKVRPGEELSSALKNYAANYYASGAGNMDLEAALAGLQKRKKEISILLREEARKRLQKREEAERAAEYIAKDLDRIQREAAAGEEEIRRGKRLLDTYEQARGEQKKKKFPLKGAAVWFAVLILLMILLPSSIRYFTAVIWAAAGLLAELWVMRPEPEREQTEEEQAVRRRIDKLKWNREKLRSDRRDRQVEYENLQEMISEACTVSEEEKNLEQKKAALELAAERMQEVSGDVRKETGNRLAKRAAEILGELTDGRYTRIFIEEGLEISIFDGIRKIPIHMMSRGTIEQIYFAVRMAASEILYEEPLPIILDDTFAYYDDKRMEAALRWLAGQKKQVLLFTCQNREKEALDHMHLAYRDGWD